MLDDEQKKRVRATLTWAKAKRSELVAERKFVIQSLEQEGFPSEDLTLEKYEAAVPEGV